MPTFRQRPPTVVARRFKGRKSAARIVAWSWGAVELTACPEELTVHTLHGGDVTVHRGDWVVRDAPGDFDVVPDRLFRESYERC